MENKKYLNEETYQKNKKKISKVALIVLIIGILIGGSLIATGLVKQSKINAYYSEENKTKIKDQLENEKQKIEEQLELEEQKIIKTKTELETKIKPTEDEIKSLERVKFTGFDDAYYARQDRIEELEKSISSDKKSIAVIEDVLEDSDFYCSFDGEKNDYTVNYCSIEDQLDAKVVEINSLEREFSDFNKKFDSHDSIPFYMIGTFIIIASCMIAGSIYMITKRREMLAFGVQQIMPIAEEGAEKIAPTIGKVGKTIAKEMAPVYGEIAKEISKGIKEGIKEDEKNKK